MSPRAVLIPVPRWLRFEGGRREGCALVFADLELFFGAVAQLRRAINGDWRGLDHPREDWPSYIEFLPGLTHGIELRRDYEGGVKGVGILASGSRESFCVILGDNVEICLGGELLGCGATGVAAYRDILTGRSIVRLVSGLGNSPLRRVPVDFVRCVSDMMPRALPERWNRFARYEVDEYGYLREM